MGDSGELSPALLAAIFESATDAIVVTDDDRRFVAVNAATGTLLGCPQGELLGTRIEEVAAPAHRERIVAAFRLLLGSGVHTGVMEVLRADGSIRVVENSTRANVLPGRHVTVLRDVTERVESERRLAGMAVDLAEVERVGRTGGWAWDAASGGLTWSPGLPSALGYAPGTPVPEDLTRLFTQASADTVGLVFADALATAAPFELDAEYVRQDGEHGWAVIRGAPEVAADGTVTGYRGTAVDITERKRTEDALAASEARFRAAFDDNPEVIAVLRPVHAADGSFEDVEVAYLNRAARTHYHDDADGHAGLIGRRLFESRPLMRPVLHDAYEEMARSRIQLRGEIHGMTQGGEVWASYILFPLGDEFVHVGRDITAERRAAQVVAQSEERFRRTLETLIDPLVIVRAVRDEAGRIVDFVVEYANGAAARYDVLKSAVGRPISALAPDAEVTRFVELYAQVVETGVPLALDGITMPSTTPDARGVMIDVRAHKLGESVVSTWRDVSEQRVLADQVARANRLESLGRLAAGVAHDFNNVLHGVGLMAELIAQNAESTDVIAEAQEIIAAAERGREMTRSLLAFAQGGSSERRPVNPGSLVRETVALLERVLGRSVTIAMRIPDGLPPILADEAGLARALINLAVNARDAMPKGGTLKIELHATRLQGAGAHAIGVTPGKYVVVAVTDTGEGIKPELIDRIFEPFFTTKPPGVGTGLGLATTYGFVKANGGGISVESEVGCGSTFRLHLPVV